ncbi:short-chain dehydrogenase reductase SDR [Fusarium pseudocircinatum]|uniref:Short-chain dehydrogenase reductase SDR n=1 Tax=Fusarium pseudocircinatum TaxID=56676 RepID=A0A8H5PLF7_9HYPO|nr:short-chain dehydrogenase reductase SDR [Fusarium pseudocircinatum]
MGSIEHLVALPPASSPYGGSKAALNWFIRRLRFEEPWLTSFVVRPGLVETDMAAATFGDQLSVYGSITIETSVKSLVNVADRASKELSGTFQNYDGTPFPW